MGKKKKLARFLAAMEGLRIEQGPPPTRPCLVDEKPAVFHRFVEEDRALLQINAYCEPGDRERIRREFQETGVYPDTCYATTLRSTLALVEFPDGSLRKVDPELVTLLSNKYK